MGISLNGRQLNIYQEAELGFLILHWLISHFKYATTL